MRIGGVVLGLFLLLVATAGAQEPAPTEFYDPVGSFDDSGDGGFTALFWLMVPVALIGAYVGLRRDWHAGTFFERSRVDVTDRPDLPLPSQTAARRPSVEERLAEIERLKAKGLITGEEHARLRADVLADVTRD